MNGKLKNELKALLDQAQLSLENLDKPSYNKKNWTHNLILCLEKAEEIYEGYCKK